MIDFKIKKTKKKPKKVYKESHEEPTRIAMSATVVAFSEYMQQVYDTIRDKAIIPDATSNAVLLRKSVILELVAEFDFARFGNMVVCLLSYFPRYEFCNTIHLPLFSPEAGALAGFSRFVFSIHSMRCYYRREPMPPVFIPRHREAVLAVVMGKHSRLGRDSRISLIEYDVLLMIEKFVVDGWEDWGDLEAIIVGNVEPNRDPANPLDPAIEPGMFNYGYTHSKLELRWYDAQNQFVMELNDENGDSFLHLLPRSSVVQVIRQDRTVLRLVLRENPDDHRTPTMAVGELMPSIHADTVPIGVGMNFMAIERIRGRDEILFGVRSTSISWLHLKIQLSMNIFSSWGSPQSS